MDNYPKHLAPEFDEGGGVKTPFEVWWPRVREEFPTVPEEVAQHWLHEHWSHSPYEWLVSRSYQFERVDWRASEIPAIRSTWCNFEASNIECREHGEHLLTRARACGYRTARFMHEHKTFPTPIVVLDNGDGHLRPGQNGVPAYEPTFPTAYLLIEGHRRFNMALHLQSIGELRDPSPVWLMTRL